MSNLTLQHDKEPWYKKGWGVLLIAFIAIVLIGLLYISLKTADFYKQIQLGDIPPKITTRLTRAAITLPKNLKADLAYSTDQDPPFGNPDAPLQIVEFADFECPFSRDESLVVRELQARFPNLIYYVYRDFPLDEIHPHASHAAEAANCAQDQGKFWAMHDKLYQNADRLTDLDLKTYALEIGLNIVEFNKCFDGRKYKDEIEIDRADGIASGVQGTPTFFINGQMVPGAIPIEIWEQIIAKVR